MNMAKKRNKKKIGLVKTILITLLILIISIVGVYFSIKKLNSDTCKLMINSVIPIVNAKNVDSTNSNLASEFFTDGLSRCRTWISYYIPAISIVEASNNIVIEVDDVSQSEERLPIVESKIISDNRIKNDTTYSPDFNALLNQELSFEINKNLPSILIVHTHASESYTPTNQNSYLPSDPSRTEDTRFNMVRVGEEMTKELKKYGLNVIHDKTIHDYPSYTNSYKNTLTTIDEHLENNPSIQIVLDIHRDALQAADGTKTKLVTELNGEKVAQVLVLCGTNQAGLPNDHWEENLKFALKIQDKLDKFYPGLARPLSIRKERFNMHATNGSLILEIGTNGNTLEEALASIKYLAKCVAEVL